MFRFNNKHTAVSYTRTLPFTCIINERKKNEKKKNLLSVVTINYVYNNLIFWYDLLAYTQHQNHASRVVFIYTFLHILWGNTWGASWLAVEFTTDKVQTQAHIENYIAYSEVKV